MVWPFPKKTNDLQNSQALESIKYLVKNRPNRSNNSIEVSYSITEKNYLEKEIQDLKEKNSMLEKELIRSNSHNMRIIENLTDEIKKLRDSIEELRDNQKEDIELRRPLLTNREFKINSENRVVNKDLDSNKHSKLHVLKKAIKHPEKNDDNDYELMDSDVKRIPTSSD